VQVVIGAPPVIAADMLRCFGIKLVVRGSVSETNIKVDGNGSRCVWVCGPEARTVTPERGGVTPSPARLCLSPCHLHKYAANV